MLEPTLRANRLLQILAVPGRQSLTLYIAHIVFGMGILGAMGLIGRQSASDAMIAALMLRIAAALFALVWSRTFQRGPLELLMRRLTG